MSRRPRSSPLAIAFAAAIAFATLFTTPAAATATGFQPLPTLPVNACGDSTLPRTFGTNFPNPTDPNGYGFANQSIIGWEGNVYAPFTYLSGAYYARGVPARFTQGGTTYCGGMYSFGVYNYGLAAGQAPAPGSVQWTMADGYLPAMTTSFTRAGVAVSITDFADRQAIGGAPVELVYTRVTVHNLGTTTVTVPSDASGPALVALNSDSDTVAPNRTVHHDFVSSVDTFSTAGKLPDPSALVAARPYDAAFGHMRDFWRNRISVIPELSLPQVTLPDSGGLADPGTAMANAYKAAFVYTRIAQVGTTPFSGANNYDWLLNHDLPGILANRFTLGDFTDAQNLLLVGRISEQSNFNEFGANWYWDGLWKTPAAWADYLAATNDTTFVSTYFHDDANAPSPWGPSLFTMMHTDYLAQLDSTTHYLKTSFDNDSTGTWLFDDESALAGLAAYKYIATRIGQTTEAQWADGAYTSLLNATNAGLAANEQANNFDFLPCEVNKPITADRCNNSNDANWAGSNLWGQNVWDIYLQGGKLGGILGDPQQTDNLYQAGYARLAGTLPFPTLGAYSGYSTAHNTGYTAASLYGNDYRGLSLSSYAWQLQTTTGGPNAWWEANGSAPDPNNPWAGSHAAPQFGAIPYAWPMAGQTQTVLQSLVASGLVSTTRRDGSFDFHTALYVGRGVPDAWIVPGQTIAVDNLTSSYQVGSGHRKTYGVRITTDSQHGDRVVRVTMTGQSPTDDVRVQLPVFADAGVLRVDGGSYDPATHTVTMRHGSVRVLLGHAARPTVTLGVASTVPGQHTRPALTAGAPATASATFTNTGQDTLGNVGLTLPAPAGWTVTPATTTHFPNVPPGRTVSATWTVTPPATMNGSNGLRVAAGYTARDNGASGSVSAMQWTDVRRPLPLPPGSTDLATSATPSASYTSPWEHVTAINDGIYPTGSNDSQDLRWGTWPMTGTQWIELDWTTPVTTNGGAVYFLDDGGGVRLPASWTVQYWNGSAFVDVPNASAYPIADDVFNGVTFDPVTTTRMRVTLQSGQGSVGVIQWLVDSTAGN